MFRSFCVIFSCCVVLIAASDTECGMNQEIRCVQSCPPQKTCRNLNIGYGCLQVVEQCKSQCVCLEGFVRNDEGDCILEGHCEPLCTGENEEFNLKCKNSCPPGPDACSSFFRFGKPTPCDSPVLCDEGCFCKSGYRRQEEGSPCIPLCECSELRDTPMCKT